MSTAGAALTATQLAQDLGISVQMDDIPKVVAAIHRAYGTGVRDGRDDAMAQHLWGYFHTTCIYESGFGLVSLHHSKAGAWKAMHRAQWSAWDELQSRQRTRRWFMGIHRGGGRDRGMKAYEHQSSMVSRVEVLP